MALEGPLVREAVGVLNERGVKVLTLISDLSHRIEQPSSASTIAPPNARPAS